MLRGCVDMYPGSEPSGIREQDEGKERRLWATAYLTVFC